MATAKKQTTKALEKPKADDTSPMTPDRKAKAALSASVNNASVIVMYQDNIMGKDVDINAVIEGLHDTCENVHTGDLKSVETMLVTQAKALQTIFTSLARKAHGQTHQKHYEAFLGLALKAQAQSRATITALVDLKFPRQATYVKQANIAHGAQKVNNGIAPDNQTAQYAHAHAPAKELSNPQNKLLEATHGQQGYSMDTRAPQKAKRSHQAVEAVESVHRR
jgi:predicted RNA-binding Zn ribbon-like protein